MKKGEIWMYVIILFITILAVVINLSQPYAISIDTKIPFINKQVSIHQKIPGINTNFSIGSFHFQKDFALRKGLDLQGGTSITLRADMKGIPESERETALNSAKSVIERRI